VPVGRAGSVATRRNTSLHTLGSNTKGDRCSRTSSCSLRMSVLFAVMAAASATTAPSAQWPVARSPEPDRIRLAELSGIPWPIPPHPLFGHAAIARPRRALRANDLSVLAAPLGAGADAGEWPLTADAACALRHADRCFTAARRRARRRARVRRRVAAFGRATSATEPETTLAESTPPKLRGWFA
jgi:hypothetical protein